jgi:hypothetical protein
MDPPSGGRGGRPPARKNGRQPDTPHEASSRSVSAAFDRGPPGKERGPEGSPPGPVTPPPPSCKVEHIVTDGGDPAARLLELAGEWAKGVLADVTILSEKAAARAREIPDAPELAREVRALWTVLGEVLLRVAVLEQDLYERDQAAKGKPVIRHGFKGRKR